MSDTHSLMKPSEALANNSHFAASNFFLINEDLQQQTIESFHSVKCGSLNLLINEDTLGEVIENIEICPLPQTSNSLVGMSSVRGNIVPIFDLHQLLDMEHAQQRDNVMVVGSGNDKVGFLIDNLPKKVRFTAEDRISRKPPLPKKLMPFIKNCFHQGELWIEWDIFDFFSSFGKQA